MRTVGLGLLAAAAVMGGCVENTAPGNDRAAEVARVAPAAPITSVGEAIRGVEPGLLMPEIMTDQDRAVLPARSSRCAFRMTRVGLPVFVHGDGAGVIKLNGKMATLSSSGDGQYRADGVTVEFRPLETLPAGGELFDAELVLRLPGAANELGFHGYADC